ncbi:hypothetical protein M23134_05311 [Microscilla marina ATCC 23134]|uniref:Uncharacterized protein n=1 Tax=Microscilla marina ATCC 23134 TaxID=313606 RepID=A1ZHH0_MICM2|nr:hypothetical protein M23134_05311 [Microscilla marina ATCC 23134]
MPYWHKQPQKTKQKPYYKQLFYHIRFIQNIPFIFYFFT